MGARKLSYNFVQVLPNNYFPAYPLHTGLPNRHEAGNEYRYGFNGMEKDDEIKGEGNSVNYKYRMHDPRVGRFFAVDPLEARYPHNSPYAFSENVVISHVELEGKEKDLNYYSDPSMFGFRANTTVQQDKENKKIIDASQRQTAKYGMLAIGLVVAWEVVAIYGIEAVTNYLIKEGIEYIIEEATGIPIITDPIDVLEQIEKKGLKSAIKKSLSETVESVKNFRQSLSKATKNIKSDKWNHIIKGSRTNEHNWDKLVKNPLKNTDKVQNIIQDVVDNGKVITMNAKEGFGTIAKKVDNEWVVVQFGTDPNTGKKIINDAWVESRPNKIKELQK